MLDIPCVIFAGGKSSRMGEDKALLPFSTFTSLTEFQYSRLTKIFKTVYISCKDKQKFSFDANYIEDIQVANVFAPTLGFISLFNTLEQESVFVLSVDAPFVSEAIIKALVDVDKSSNDATIAKTLQGVQPLCGIYHRSLHQSFQDMLISHKHKLGYLLKNSKTSFVEFEDEELFLNLNDKDEYAKALKLLD